MSYEDFLIYLKNNKLTIKKVTSILGYSEKSIYNNWKKDKNIPEIALKSLKYYIELEKIKEKYTQLEKQLKLLSQQTDTERGLSKKSLQIAKKKCHEHNIKLEDYLSSLICANI